MKCPHPNCYKPITRPYYRCSSGQHEHRNLRPGLYGVLWRTCACGERLPTMFVFKLHRLNAWCPRCSRPVPSGLGSAPLIHLPLIGGSSAGKTALLTAIVDSLERLPQRDKITVEFASDVSRAGLRISPGTAARRGLAERHCGLCSSRVPDLRQEGPVPPPAHLPV